MLDGMNKHMDVYNYVHLVQQEFVPTKTFIQIFDKVSYCGKTTNKSDLNDQIKAILRKRKELNIVKGRKIDRLSENSD